MSRCRHRDVRGWTRTDAGLWSLTCNGSRDSVLLNRVYLASLDRVTCMDCNAWLPLGPARDTAETEVEVRAAALAQAVREERLGRADETWTEEENDGWNYHRQGWTPPADYEAGWLAREIWEDQ